MKTMKTLLVLFLLVCSSFVFASSQLTPAQNALIRADVAANADLNIYPMVGDGAFAIALLYNAPAAPSFIVWKNEVVIDEIMRNGMDWTRVDNLSVGKARIWDYMTRLGVIDAGKVNIRSGIDAAWVGTAQDLAVRAAVYVHCKKPATRLQKLLSTGTGTDAIPATMSFTGIVSYQQIEAAR